VKVQKAGPEWVPELKGPSSSHKGETSKGKKADRGDKVSISDEARLLQKARRTAQGRSPDIEKIRGRLREGYYSREDVLREVVRRVVAELLGWREDEV